MERIKNYWQETLAGLISIIIALSFYLLLDEGALSIAIAIILAGFSVQAALIKSNVEEALKNNLELYNFQKSINNPIFKKRAKMIMDECLCNLRNLAQGTYEVYGSEPAFVENMRFYEQAKANDEIKSVLVYEKDMILDGIFLKHHKEAIERGVIIVKIFIVPDEETKEYYNRIKAFKDVGVKTSLVQRETIGYDSRLFADFFLYNNIVAISTQGHNGLLRSLKITMQKRDFDDYTHRFEELLKVACPF